MRLPQVHWFYKRVKVNAPVQLLYFELAGGLAFLLRRFHLMQPDFASGVLFPKCGVELTDGTGKLRWQLQAIPADIYSAPRSTGVTVKTETAPQDQSGYGVNLSAIFKPRANTVNLFYDVGEQVNIRISGMEFVAIAGIWGPPYIDIAVEGYYIP